MSVLRKNTNPRNWDIAPQLQATLNANGMQAHLIQTPTGQFQLVTLAHNSSTPRYYDLTSKQVENLRNGGTNSWNKKAYETFTSIVRNDYYMPGAWVTAKNANSPVNHGLWGHTIMDGEYGYREPRFGPFMGARYGRFNNFMDRYAMHSHRGFHIRRIEGRPYFASSAPVVIDRPDGKLKPGEFKSGAYGFYDKGTQATDPLSSLEIQAKPKVLVRPQGQAEPLDKVMGTNLYPTPELFQHMLSTHGVIIDEKNKTLTIKSSQVNRNLQYELKDEELAKLMAENFKPSGKKSSKQNKVVTIDERLSIINQVIEGDFKDQITRQMLNSKDYVSICLKPEVEKELFISHAEATHHQKQLDVIALEHSRASYHTGYIDKWNSIGVAECSLRTKASTFPSRMEEG